MYAQSHFQMEDQLMEKYNYPPNKAIEHRDSHLAFIQMVVKLRKQFCKTTTFELSEKTLNFLKEWLITHEMMSDKALCRHIMEVTCVRCKPKRVVELVKE